MLSILDVRNLGLDIVQFLLPHDAQSLEVIVAHRGDLGLGLGHQARLHPNGASMLNGLLVAPIGMIFSNHLKVGPISRARTACFTVLSAKVIHRRQDRLAVLLQLKIAVHISIQRRARP
jgi:hypothetical protein